MAVEISKTAWGNAVLEHGTPGAGDTMSTELTQTGYVLEDSLGITLEDGTELKLTEEGGITRDLLQNEGTLKITGTLIGIPKETRDLFWDTDTEGDKTSVKSMVTSGKFSFRMSTPKVVGSEALEIPYCSVNLGLAYASNQGWTCPFTITALKGATGKLFDIVTVAEPNTED